MSYEKALKHFKNHRKDKYHQQCSFSISTHEKSSAEIAEKYAMGFYVGSLQTKEPISPLYNDSDLAVDFYRTLPVSEQKNVGIFSDKGVLFMR